MRRTAKITNWMVQPSADGAGFVLKGTVSEHQTYPEATEGVVTSPLTEINFETGIAKSLNTDYTLGDLQRLPA